MNLYGLIGKTLKHSFSEKYFSEKFKNENIQNSEYKLFPLEKIEDIEKLILENQNLRGLNVTIPYKNSVIKFLDEIDETAKNIDAVNTIKISKKNGKTTLKGYNTDILGFSESLKPLLKKHHKKALILGTGGAGKAIAYSLQKLNINYLFVGRKKTSILNIVEYKGITKEMIQEYSIIINCTPLGTFPDIDSCPDIPYEYLNSKHLLFDLVYNPKITKFMKLGKKNGANVKNGYEMLKIQAEEAWGIFGKV